MSDNPIVFIDSGVGGLPYLEMARNYLPEENYTYVADTGNFPYGEKDATALQIIILELITDIVNRISPKLIVVACNTASVVALPLLRDRFGIPFVGVVPAIKPAAEFAAVNRNGGIGLLATRKTIEDPYTDTLIEDYASSVRVDKYAGINLVDFVEHNFITSTDEEKMEVISESAEYFSRLEIDSLVLGCTHFIYLEEYFRRHLGSSVAVIDSRKGVSRQIKKIIKTEGLVSDNKKRDIFYVTCGKGEQLNYQRFAEKFSLEWGGVL